MSDERRNDKRAIFLLRLASEDFDKKPSPHGLLDHFDGEDEFTESDAIRAALRELDRLTAERDAARAELAKLRAAVSRREDVYPTETIVIRSADVLLVELSQLAFFLGDIRKSKEASYRAQYIRAALGNESEAEHD